MGSCRQRWGADAAGSGCSVRWRREGAAGPWARTSMKAGSGVCPPLQGSVEASPASVVPPIAVTTLEDSRAAPQRHIQTLMCSNWAPCTCLSSVYSELGDEEHLRKAVEYIFFLCAPRNIPYEKLTSLS